MYAESMPFKKLCLQPHLMTFIFGQNYILPAMESQKWSFYLLDTFIPKTKLRFYESMGQTDSSLCHRMLSLYKVILKQLVGLMLSIWRQPSKSWRDRSLTSLDSLFQLCLNLPVISAKTLLCFLQASLSWVFVIFSRKSLE